MSWHIPACNSCSFFELYHFILILDERAPEWLYLKPSVYLQQIIVRGKVEPWNIYNLSSMLVSQVHFFSLCFVRLCIAMHWYAYASNSQVCRGKVVQGDDF